MSARQATTHTKRHGKVRRIVQPVCHAVDGMAAVYDDFAWFYNRYWNEEFHSLAFPILERIWLARVPAGAHILDVCCGTGYLAGLLSGRGYRVFGIDASPEMIRFAHQNTSQADFEAADIVHFRANRQYDAAASTFDSLNHILEIADLEAAFRNTATALKPGALFAFDVLLEEAYLTHWGEAFALVRDDHLLTITGAGYDFRTSLACCTITMFRMVAGAWRRSDVVVRERCYTIGEIGAVLERTGFGEVSCYHARDLGMAGQIGEGRTFFIVKKL